MSRQSDVVLRLCTLCKDGAGAAALKPLQAAIEARALPVQVMPQACMNGCETPTSVALQGRGRATYFFTGVDPQQDASDILATLETYLASPEGWIEDARGCGRLRFCLTGRVPALPEPEA